MPDEIEKPRKVRDIRQRLGRMSMPSETAEAEQNGAVPPPPSIGGVAPPPGFVGGRVGRPAGPFAAAPAAIHGKAAPAKQEVRIVVDEQAVDSAKEDSAKRTRKMMLIAGAAAGVLGILLGMLAGSITARRRAYNVAVTDGKDIYTKVREASDQVAKAKTLLDRAEDAAKSRPGASPSVDYATIEELRALPVPFSSAEFVGRRYDKFSAETVNALFAYTRKVDELWDRFDRVASHSLPAPRRAELDEAAQDETAVSASPTGCVPTLGEGGFRCGLVYVDLPDGEDAASTKVKVRATRGGRPFEKELFRGQDLRTGPSNYVILTNPEQSEGVLGQRRNAFTEYRKELAGLSSLMGEVLEAQGQLEKGLGQIAGLQELSTF
jgi:hypothetical protein